jgi:hypothetical protein
MLPAIILVLFPMTCSVMLLVTSFVVVPVTCSVMLLVTRPRTAITCLRWRRPSDQKHCKKSNYYNFTDVFHFDSPFTRISRRGEEKGYGFFSPDISSAEAAWMGGKRKAEPSLTPLLFSG